MRYPDLSRQRAAWPNAGAGIASGNRCARYPNKEASASEIARLHVLNPSADPASHRRRHSARRQRAAGHADRAARRAGRLFARHHRLHGHRLFRRLPARLRLHHADHESGRPCALVCRSCRDRIGRHVAAGADHRSGDVVGDPLCHRLLLCRPLHHHGKLAELRRVEPRPRAGAGALPHHRHRLGHRGAVPDPGFRRRRLHHLRHHVDHDHAVAGAGFARRPLQSDSARRRQARPCPRVAHLAARPASAALRSA